TPYSTPMPGNMWDESEPPQDLDLRLLRVGAAPLNDDGTVLQVRLETTRGTIEGILHPVEGGTGAVVCVGGAMGGLDGPADKLYERLAGLLAPSRVTVLRLNYREPNNFEECVLDTLAGCSFLRGIGAAELALVGHSFGGAVVIKAGELHDAVRGVVSMSPQLYGTREVENLGKPLLLIHGMSDGVLNHEASEDIYRRALEPKRIALFAEAGHSLIQAKDQIDQLLIEWLPARLAGDPMRGGREEHEVGG
ncbi:MAG TPA: dienelactone hydrolase family protein, partial [Tepidiformaceae bacterium]|nr:dienelactone hydrolase family protein [Tepidiformaceae bacterium]